MSEYHWVGVGMGGGSNAGMGGKKIELRASATHWNTHKATPKRSQCM